MKVGMWSRTWTTSNWTSWFERLTKERTKEQRADFKQKFANADHLNRADQRLRMIAYDVAATLHGQLRESRL